MLCNFACSFENDYNKIANVNICHQLKTNNTWTISVNVYIWPLLEKKGLNCASLCACVCVIAREEKKSPAGVGKFKGNMALRSVHSMGCETKLSCTSGL